MKSFLWLSLVACVFLGGLRGCEGNSMDVEPPASESELPASESELPASESELRPYEVEESALGEEELAFEDEEFIYEFQVPAFEETELEVAETTSGSLRRNLTHDCPAHRCDKYASSYMLGLRCRCTCRNGFLGTGSKGDCHPEKCFEGYCDENATATQTFWWNWALEKNENRCVCKCNKNYAGTGRKGECADVTCQKNYSRKSPDEECVRDVCFSNPCDVNATCENTEDGGYKCTCNDGFQGSGEKRTCHTCRCPEHSDCVQWYNLGMDEYRTISCWCHVGYRYHLGACVPTSCDPRNWPCDQEAHCKDRPGTGGKEYDCKCKTAYRGSGRKGDCVRDYCSTNPCNKNADCTNLHNGAVCKCHEGFYTKDYGRPKAGFGRDGCYNQTCEYAPCDVDAECILDDTPKGYHCKCLPYYEGSGEKGDCKLDCSGYDAWKDYLKKPLCRTNKYTSRQWE